MDHKKIRALGALALALIWAALTLCAWFGPREELSVSERRPLAQMPELSGQTLLNGSFMKEFESFSLDQFPLRDTFRGIKSLFHYYALRQSDNNGIYLADGAAVKLEYPLNRDSVSYAINRFSRLYETCLMGSGASIYMAVIPDKSYYLAQGAGALAMDYPAMFTAFREGMPWAEHIDLTGALCGEKYYHTDTHWRQEELLPAAQALANAMGVSALTGEEVAAVAVDRPFQGVYYGQAALPMEPDTMYLLESALLDSCVTYVGEIDPATGKGIFRKLYDGVYDRQRLEGEDMYEVYLSGPMSLLRVENPNAVTDRELVIIRDSFGSAVAPLLVKDYAAVTLVDIRYIQQNMLERFDINWDGDVLFLYSTLVLNNSSTIK